MPSIFTRRLAGLLLCLSAAASPQIQAAQTHPLAQEMFKRGAITCASTAHQLAALLSNGQENSLLQVLPDNPDGGMANGTFVQRGNKGNTLINMSFAPTASGCSASYRVIVYDDNSCKKSLDTRYSGKSAQSIGKTGVLLVTPSAKVQALLVPTGSGCLIMNEELVR